MRHSATVMAEATELATLVQSEIGDQPHAQSIALCAGLGAAYAWRGLADSDQRPPIVPPGEIPWSKSLAERLVAIVTDYYRQRFGQGDPFERERRLRATVRCFLVNLFPLVEADRFMDE
jgi:hypothetical protein